MSLRWRVPMSDVLSSPAVFDANAVSSLTGHDDDVQFALDFVARFRRLLPGRVRRIESAMLGDDYKEAMDAVLSLRTSACTLGAQELCAVSTRIEEHLRASDLHGARVAAQGLAGAEHRADEAFATFLS
jgi:HPt (histidine-containing phosphotransfer) domain-containing protein